MSTHVGPVVKHLVNKEKKVVAMWAPATLAQFPGTQGQWAQACLKAGFAELHEVAVGADVTSITETTEFLERVGGGKIPLMTTSCCPAFVRSINQHIPGLVPYVSTSKSPMGYSGDLIKARDGPNVITVFVGPCTAKRQETLRHPNTDYAITSEELLCIFTALNIDPTKMPEEDPKTTRYGSSESANYCVTQGVTQAVVHAVPLAIDGLVNAKEWGGHMADPTGSTINIGPKDVAAAQQLAQQPHAHAHEKVAVIGAEEKKVELKPIFISPLTQESFKQLQTWGANISKVEGNLIECMCCDGGCIGGPGNIVAPSMGLGRLKKILAAKPEFKDIEDVMSLK